MRKMLINVLFPDTYRLGKVACAQIVFAKELSDLFPNRLLVDPNISCMVQWDEASLCRSSCPSVFLST